MALAALGYFFYRYRRNQRQRRAPLRQEKSEGGRSETNPVVAGNNVVHHELEQPIRVHELAGDR